MSTIESTYDDPTVGGEAIARDRSRELLDPVMGFVTVTVGFAALGAYLGRDLSGVTGLLFWLPLIVGGIAFAMLRRDMPGAVS